jgi:GH24 family phage-related lysozyme (muramidase)
MAQTVSLGAAHPAVDFDVAMEVASHEALIRQTYKDSVGKLNLVRRHDQRNWSQGRTLYRQTRRLAALHLCLGAGNYAAGVHRAFKGHKITTAQFAATLSFHWNTGEIETASWVKLWKAGDVAGAKKAIMHWVTPPEIAGRRKKERDLFFDGKWSNDGRMTEYTQLTAKMTPMWSSAVKVDVSVELRKAFAKPVPVKLDVPMQPDAPVEVPTLSRARGESWAHQ